MILAFDTYYNNDKAKTVCLSFEGWDKEDHFIMNSEIIPQPEMYVSGEFYKRELPCILSLLLKLDLKEVDSIIVDGFVFLDDESKFGLGAHLYYALDKAIPVIGVAKRDFATIEKNKRKLCRGKSKNPLFITSIGIELEMAAQKIEGMKGEYRIPSLLKELDRLTKEK
jgi:deoxyribonuclease V